MSERFCKHCFQLVAYLPLYEGWRHIVSSVKYPSFYCYNSYATNGDDVLMDADPIPEGLFVPIDEQDYER